jgi:chemotaxis-related protein WspB
MLCLLFQVGEDRYAMDTAEIVEVLPLVNLTRIPQAPADVAGLFNYRGVPVPVVDLTELTIGRPADRRLNTRIVLVRVPVVDDRARIVGMIAERATRTVRWELSDFALPGLRRNGAPSLGSVATDAHGLVHWFDARTLLPASVRDLLFKSVADEATRIPPPKA